MSRFIDLTNQKFGRLTVIEKVPNPPNIVSRGARWLCKCDCGNYKEASSESLRRNKTRSCGCLLSESNAKRSYKHGYYGTRLYQVYIDMMSRCHDSNHTWFKSYGAKGITVCKEWYKNPKAFCDWAMSNGYNDKLTIDRIDGTKGYSPDNCRWADSTTQNFNKPLSPRNTSGYRGVSFNKKYGKYVAYINKNKKSYSLGTFDSPEEAYKARLEAERKLYSELE